MTIAAETSSIRKLIGSAAGVLLLVFLVPLLSLPAFAAGAPLLELQKLVAAETVTGDNFSYSVALDNDGNTALVAAPLKNTSTGVVYVFTKTSGTWVQQQLLSAPDLATGDYFGASVSISGDGNTALVGAYGKALNTGAVYVFIRSGATWTQQQKLTASDAATGDYFGMSITVSADGNTALVGVNNKNSNAGVGYVFARSGTTWTEQQKLTALDSAANDFFGISVSLAGDGNTALIGAHRKSTSTGAAYLFTRSGTTWNQQQKLTASDAATGDYFGYALAVSSDGSTALVGAYKKASFAGAAYVFTKNGASWSEQQKLTASDSASNTNFSWSLSLSSDGNTALIGAHGTNQYAGAAYLFTRSATTWSQQQKLTASDTATGDYFGFSTSLSGDGATAMLGAYKKNSSTGAAYLFTGLRFCGDGYYDNRIACAPCDTGTYQIAGTHDACLYCPSGLFQPFTGQSSCLRYCGAGQYDNGSACLPCPVGTYQSEFNFKQSCTPAPAGTFVTVPGAAAPTVCPSGTFQGLTGQMSCLPCPAGTSQPATGQTACLAIPKTATSILSDPSTAPATLYAAIDTAGVYKSSNGSSWSAANGTPPNSLGNLRVKALVRSSGGVLYAATYGGGVFKSATAAADWSACATQPSNLNVVSLLIDANGRLFAGTEAGIYASTDGCGTWNAMNGGLP